MDLSCSQTDKKEFTLDEEDLKLCMPLTRYIDEKMSQYSLPQLIAELTKNMVEIEIINLRPQFVTILPAPRQAWRIELDMTKIPSIQCLIRAGLYIKEAMDTDPQARFMLNGYDQENHPIAIRALRDRMPPPDKDDTIRRPTSWLTRIPSLWPRDPDPLARIVVTYFIFFCVIGIVFTLYL